MQAGQNRIISSRIITGRNSQARIRKKISLSIGAINKFCARLISQMAGQPGLIRHRRIRKTRRIGQQRGGFRRGVQPRHQRQQNTGINTP